MIHAARALNVKKLERTSACAIKLSIGRTYETATTSTEKKTHGRQKNMPSRDKSYKKYSTGSRKIKPPDGKKPALGGLFVCMVHSTGFEPVTARFVAEYSIQLSYECRLWFYTRSQLVGAKLPALLQLTLKWCTRQDSNL